MSQKLINLNPDLTKLRNEGYSIKVLGSYLVVENVPYLDSSLKVCEGTLVTNLELQGDHTLKPSDHTVYFIGQHPHNITGQEITEIKNSSDKQNLADGLIADHKFSAKPQGGYNDYYHKMITYCNIICSQAQAVDFTVTPRKFNIIVDIDDDSVFQYLDTHSSRSGIESHSSKFKNLKIGIIGLGGTGSYILDFVSKTPVKEIHIFDSDYFFQHNAFRSPGAADKSDIEKKLKKVDFFSNMYAKMHKFVTPHPINIDQENLNEIHQLDFVFISIDSGQQKKVIIDSLIKKCIPFIDCGIGVEIVDQKLRGTIRATSSNTSSTNLFERISFAETSSDAYNQNIQISELNALNAALAVIKWKKMCLYYHDITNGYNSLYNIDENKVINDEN